MATARYWRLSGITTRGGQFLELAALELWGEGAMLAATLTCAVAPITGTLANLSDADLLTTAKYAVCPGLAFVFDLGTDATADTPRFGAAGLAEFVESVTLESSADNVLWTYANRFNRVIYPGSGVLTQLGVQGFTPTTYDPTFTNNVALSNGNLTASSFYANGIARSIASASSGKYYWEVTPTNGAFVCAIGICQTEMTPFGNSGGPLGWEYHGYGGTGYRSHNLVSEPWGAPCANGDTIGVALDLDAGTLSYYKNGVHLGIAFTGITGTIHACVQGASDGAGQTSTTNFGATPFAYAPPAGFYPGFGSGDTTPSLTNFASWDSANKGSNCTLSNGNLTAVRGY